MSQIKQKLGSLSAQEKLRVWRRREKLTQPQAATTLEAPLEAYRTAERTGEGAAKLAKGLTLGKLHEGEKAFVLRLRSGKTIADVATAVGRCPFWVSRLEQGGKGNFDLLANYWS